jgi:hypothetical protein
MFAFTCVFSCNVVFSWKGSLAAPLVMFRCIFVKTLLDLSVNLFVAVRQNFTSKSTGHYAQLINQINGFADLSDRLESIIVSC